MPCPTLKDLPLPPSAKFNWPWAEDGPQLPDTLPDGSQWPKISIITPSFNQGKFIEETIRSVLLQGYPHLEYIIIDGGSNDNSVDIIRKYEKYLAYWVSEADDGQTDAINKGFALASGHIVAWLNSDDLYVKNTLKFIVQHMWAKGKIIRPIVYGDCDCIDSDGKFQKRWYAKPVTTEQLITFWKKGFFIPQPTVFMADYTLKNVCLDKSLRYVMDWDLYIRLSKKYPFFSIPECLAKFRIHNETKSAEGESIFREEQRRIVQKYWKPGFQAMQFQLEYCLSPIIEIIQRVPWLMRIFLRNILKERTYVQLKQIKRRFLPRHGCPFREKDRYL